MAASGNPRISAFGICRSGQEQRQSGDRISGVAGFSNPVPASTHLDSSGRLLNGAKVNDHMYSEVAEN
ncbi:hypothetical protein N7474_007400 [Penicillium riverlandense]|uniref:uncharacterized protein n=1 Tax=Penicillium riverlandense TaxID=1903569 RepID=UPI002546C6F7|nr:uncharacterized protein N7474_007400 [Penicillium riverlandense]KAJ5815623.1 hypothetical protein N7474_007400 [Penicillium riverlandense]